MRRTFHNAEPIAAILAIVAAAASGCNKPKEAAAGGADDVVRVVRVEPVSRADLREWLDLPGEVFGEFEVDVYAEIPERVVAVKVAMGDFVKAGQVLFELRRGTLGDSVIQSNAGLEAARQQLASAETDLERFERLLKSGVVTESQVLQLRTAVDTARSQVVQLEAGVRQSRTVASKSTVVAPISGFVTNVNLEPGAMAMPQVPACSIVLFDRVKVRALAADRDFPRLRLGLPAKVTVDTMPGFAKEGTISRLAPSIDRVSRSVALEAMFDNADHALRPGMLVDLRLLLGERPQALVVRNMSLVNRLKDGRATVFVRNGTRASKRDVRVGLREDELVEVRDGLTEKDEVVVLGQSALRDGDRIKVEDAPAAKQP
ncbi:MAG: efflux RND transporter periplasmic adaptor subunit [Deltaproteobacteria bacterium]|nr:efflux RND transporter periplasmic adaptor subunit [Deltaproteobacteria bacterium]